MNMKYCMLFFPVGERNLLLKPTSKNLALLQTAFSFLFLFLASYKPKSHWDQMTLGVHYSPDFRKYHIQYIM